MVNAHWDLVQAQYGELRNAYPGLALQDFGASTVEVQGMLDFSATYNGVALNDIFDIKIVIPEDYPNSAPRAWETGGRISNFHMYSDGSLCLGSLLDIKMKFTKNPTLKSYVENLVVPYLYSFCYKQRYNEMPYGELSHGSKGILEFYKDLFNANSDDIALAFLKILANKYRGHHPCPCLSGKKLRNCHGDLVKEIRATQTDGFFMSDYVQCLEYKITEAKSTDRRLSPSTASDKHQY